MSCCQKAVHITKRQDRAQPRGGRGLGHGRAQGAQPSWAPGRTAPHRGHAGPTGLLLVGSATDGTATHRLVVLPAMDFGARGCSARLYYLGIHLLVPELGWAEVVRTVEVQREEAVRGLRYGNAPALGASTHLVQEPGQDPSTSGIPCCNISKYYSQTKPTEASRNLLISSLELLSILVAGFTSKNSPRSSGSSFSSQVVWQLTNYHCY